MNESKSSDDWLKKTCELRHHLHQFPELSDLEENTARRIVEFFQGLFPKDLLEVTSGLGGHGVAMVVRNSTAVQQNVHTPTLMVRAELDALPIEEKSIKPHKSAHDGIAHSCGHDGHMSMLAGFASRLRTAAWWTDGGSKRVIFMFQPAEETGAGARRVLADSKFKLLPTADMVVALHNTPQLPLGAVAIKPAAFNCASRGMTVRLIGRTAHASQPENGVSPALAMCGVVQNLMSLSNPNGTGTEYRLVTVVHARLGEKAFGTAPAEAEVCATLRTEGDDEMVSLVEQATSHVEALARQHGLQMSISYEDVFESCSNDATVCKLVSASARNILPPLPVLNLQRPFRWSEDFGLFMQVMPGAMFVLGSGPAIDSKLLEDMNGEEWDAVPGAHRHIKDMLAPQLHNPDFDFPDALLDSGSRLFEEIAAQFFRQKKLNE